MITNSTISTIYFQNGYLEFTKEIKIQKELKIKDNFLDSIYIGKTSDVEELDKITKYWTENSHPQDVTDFNLWSPMLSIDEMKNWTSCK